MEKPGRAGALLIEKNEWKTFKKLLKLVFIQTEASSAGF